jgi:hypothetical protein
MAPVTYFWAVLAAFSYVSAWGWAGMMLKIDGDKPQRVYRWQRPPPGAHFLTGAGLGLLFPVWVWFVPFAALVYIYEGIEGR